MIARISSFLCGGLLFGMLASFTSAQTPTIVPEKFGCTRSALTALPRLIADLKSPDEKVRAQAIATLGSLGPIAIQAAPALVEVAVNTRGHAAALVALTKIDDESTRKALRPLLVGGKGRCRCGNSFNDVVAAAGEPIVPHLIALLAEPTISFNAESVLSQIGMPAVPHLIRGLEDKNDAVRLAVCRSLTQMGPKAKDAALALEKRLAIEQGVLKLRVAQAVHTVSGFHSAAFEILHQAVQSGDKAQRLEALQCLNQMQSKSKVLVPSVLNLLMNDDQQYHGLATGVLINIGADAVPALIDALSKSDAKRSDRLMYNLQYIGVAAAPAVPTFIKILEGNDTRLATLSAQILPSFGPDAA
jgi:HEAT repeat protein